MVQEKVFTKVLNASVALTLSSFLSCAFFITPSWGMDRIDPWEEDLPLPEKPSTKKQSTSKKKLRADEPRNEGKEIPLNGSSKSRSGITKLKDKFTAKKHKDKDKTKKEPAPPPEPKSPGRQRSNTMQTNVAPQLLPETPGRKRANTNYVVPQLNPETPGKKRGGIQLDSKDAQPKRSTLKKELTNSQKLPQPQEEVTYVKSIYSFAEWESAQTGKGLGTYRTLIIDIPVHKAEEQLAFNQLFQNPDAFNPLLSKFPKITTLSLSGLPLGQDDLRMKDLVKHLQSMPLTHLSIIKCGLKKPEMKYLSSILISSTLATTLQSLNVSKNNMGDGEVEAFLPGLKKNCSLTHLDFSYNNIHMGVKILAEALTENAVLRKQRFSQQEFSQLDFGQFDFKQLNLSHNQIEDDGAQYITKPFNVKLFNVLVENVRFFNILSDVNLGNNRITGHGIKSLLQALNDWTPPTLASSFKLHLQNNTLEITDNFNLIVLHEPEPNDLCLIQGCKLGLFGESGKLYCKYGDRDILEVPASNDPTQGLPFDVIQKTATFINMHFENDLTFETLQDQLNKIKTQLIIYTSTTGYTPILNNLEQYNDLLKTLPTKRVDVLLPDRTFYRFVEKSPRD